MTLSGLNVRIIQYTGEMYHYSIMSLTPSITAIAFDGDGTYVEEPGIITPEYAVGGSYEKCCVRENGELYLIKKGTELYANSGMEPYGEVFSYPIYKHIIGEATEYELVTYRGVTASKCKVFSNDKVGFASYADASNHSVNDASFGYYSSIGNYDKFCAMIVADAVCFNVDRHTGNHGVLFDNDTLEIIGMAPAFDHNLAMVPYAMRSDFPTIWDYISRMGPRIGDDWVSLARKVLTSELRDRLISLKGYTIPFKGDEKFPAERVELLNRLINEQIDKILK